MRIMKIGTFDKNGSPIGWVVEGMHAPRGFIAITNDGFAPHCLAITKPSDPNCPVMVNGVEIVEWTKARHDAMSQ